MENIEYGYVRVSSKDQNIDRQMAAMEDVGIPKNKIYVDKSSGKNFERTSYKRLIRRVKPGDKIFVKSIDRLGRNYDEILEEWRFLTKQKDVDIVVIDLPLLDTRNQVNGLTGKFIADLVLQILSYVAEIERDNIHQRQAEGIRSAKEKGVKFGRPSLEIPEGFDKIYKLWCTDDISLRGAAKQLGTSHHTVKKWIDRYEESFESEEKKTMEL